MSRGDHMPCVHTTGITATAMNVQVGDVRRLEEQIMTRIPKHLQSHPFLQQKHLTVFKYPPTFACPKACVILGWLILPLLFLWGIYSRPYKRWLSNSRKQAPQDSLRAKYKGIPCQVQMNLGFVISWLRLKKNKLKLALLKPTLA